MAKVFAFDVSETLQTGADHDDSGRGQPIVDEKGKVIPRAFSVLVGGQETAELLIKAQKNGVNIVLVTNNGADLDTGVIDRTLSFLANYGVVISPENYFGPPRDSDGSKVPRLQEILTKYNITIDDLVFFDDSRHNVEDAIRYGFTAIRVTGPDALQNGIRGALETLQAQKELERAPMLPKESQEAASPNDTIWASKSELKARMIGLKLLAEDNASDAEIEQLLQEVTFTLQDDTSFTTYARPPEAWAQEFLPNLSIGSRESMLGHYAKNCDKYDLIIDLSHTKFERYNNMPLSDQHVRINIGDTGMNFSELLEEITQKKIFSLIQETVSSQKKVLINCAEGQSRSATLAILYLMETYQIGAIQAFRHLQKYRPFVAPNPGYFSALLEYEKTKLDNIALVDKKLTEAWLTDYLIEYPSLNTTITELDDTCKVTPREDDPIHFINFVSCLKIMRIPFQTVDCNKYSGCVQMTSSDYAKFENEVKRAAEQVERELAERTAVETAARELAEQQPVAARIKADPLEAVITSITPDDELTDYEKALRLLKGQRHDARLDESFDALVAKIEQLKQEGKVPTDELTTALNKTHSRLTGGLTHELYSEYANTVQGKSSLALKILGGLMLALSITAVVLGVVFFPAVVGLAGTAAAAVSLSLTGTAAALTAGVTVATTSALFAGGGLGFFALSRQNGLSEAMRDVEQAQLEIDHANEYAPSAYSAD